MQTYSDKEWHKKPKFSRVYNSGQKRTRRARVWKSFTSLTSASVDRSIGSSSSFSLSLFPVWIFLSLLRALSLSRAVSLPLLRVLSPSLSLSDRWTAEGRPCTSIEVKRSAKSRALEGLIMSALNATSSPIARAFHEPMAGEPLGEWEEQRLGDATAGSLIERSFSAAARD